MEKLLNSYRDTFITGGGYYSEVGERAKSDKETGSGQTRSLAILEVGIIVVVIIIVVGGGPGCGVGGPGVGFGGPGGGFSGSRSGGKPPLLLRLKNHPQDHQNHHQDHRHHHQDPSYVDNCDYHDYSDF